MSHIGSETQRRKEENRGKTREEDSHIGRACGSWVVATHVPQKKMKKKTKLRLFHFYDTVSEFR